MTLSCHPGGPISSLNHSESDHVNLPQKHNTECITRQHRFWLQLCPYLYVMSVNSKHSPELLAAVGTLPGQQREGKNIQGQGEGGKTKGSDEGRGKDDKGIMAPKGRAASDLPEIRMPSRHCWLATCFDLPLQGLSRSWFRREMSLS